MCGPAVQLLVFAAAKTIEMDFDIIGKRYPPILLINVEEPFNRIFSKKSLWFEMFISPWNSVESQAINSGFCTFGKESLSGQ